MLDALACLRSEGGGRATESAGRPSISAPLAWSRKRSIIFGNDLDMRPRRWSEFTPPVEVINPGYI